MKLCAFPLIACMAFASAQTPPQATTRLSSVLGECLTKTTLGSRRRIIGGYPHEKPHPWIVRFSRPASGWAHFCGGSILNTEYVITAAHCVAATSTTAAVQASELLVHVERYDRSKPETGDLTREVAEIIQHPSYQGPPKGFSHDIAIFRLKTALPLDFVHRAPACLPSAGFDAEQAGLECFVAGWGDSDVSNQNSVFPPKLQVLKVPLFTDGECEEMYPRQFFSQAMTCAGFREGLKDSCQGDSGGPLICLQGETPLLIGLTSFGGDATQMCAGKDRPGVYTDVAEYIDWIERTVQRGNLEKTDGTTPETEREPTTAAPAPMVVELVVNWQVPSNGKSQKLKALPGSTLKFQWSGTHDVYKMRDEAAFEACDFDGARPAATAHTTSPVIIKPEDTAAGINYFACRVADHCTRGQKAAITVTTEDEEWGLGVGWGGMEQAQQYWDSVYNSTFQIVERKCNQTCAKGGEGYIGDCSENEDDYFGKKIVTKFVDTVCENKKTTTIVVIIAAAVAALLLLVCTVWCLWKKKCPCQKKPKEPKATTGAAAV